ncbi:MAG TPA: BON domain-containing protein [Candidatus Sulfotelmatobacter sp.]|jgi:hyperosmotically inducible protein|nr:BON domain-containing protein [Candidatus Sulfotelmatobacter sp.]
MRSRIIASLVLSVVIAVGVACSNQSKAPDVKANIENSLNQAGLRDVSVSQDRDKGVVTLSGNVPTDADKSQAASIAQSIAGSQVVSNQISIRPTGDESTAKTVDSDLDKAIDKNVDAKLVQLRMNHNVSHDVKNGVVTLKGKVPSQSARASIEKAAAAVPNVKQVVNELEVKGQKATSTTGE